LVLIKKILVLGGSGFLGSAAANGFAKELHEVKIFSPSAEKINFKNNIEGVAGSIADFKKMKPHLLWADEIYHFVSTTNPKSSFGDPAYDITSNLLPLLPILDFLKDHKEKYLIFCSSGGAVYGNLGNNLIDESHPKNPQSSYGIVKSMMEEYILYYQRLFGIKALILRPSNIYGLKMYDIGKQGLISTLIQNALEGASTQIWVPVDTSKDYLFIDDFIEALIGLEKKEVFGIFNIAAERNYSIQEIITSIEEITGRKIEIKLHISTLAKIDVPVRLSSQKLKAEFGWEPKIDLKRGIENIYKRLLSKH